MTKTSPADEGIEAARRDVAALVEAAKDAVAIIDRIDAHYAHNPSAGIRQPEFPLRVPRSKLDALRAALEPFAINTLNQEETA